MDVVPSEQAASKKRLPHGMWEDLEITSCCSICTEKHESRKQVTSLQKYITSADKHWQFGGSDDLLIISRVWPTVNHNLLLSVDFFLLHYLQNCLYLTEVILVFYFIYSRNRSMWLYKMMLTNLLLSIYVSVGTSCPVEMQVSSFLEEFVRRQWWRCVSWAAVRVSLQESSNTTSTPPYGFSHHSQAWTDLVLLFMDVFLTPNCARLSS